MANPPRRRTGEENQGGRDGTGELLPYRIEALELWRDDITALLEKNRKDFEALSDRHIIMLGADPGSSADKQIEAARRTRAAIDVAEDIRQSREKRSALVLKVLGAFLLGIVALLVPLVGHPVLGWLGSAFHVLNGGAK